MLHLTWTSHIHERELQISMLSTKSNSNAIFRLPHYYATPYYTETAHVTKFPYPNPNCIPSICPYLLLIIQELYFCTWLWDSHVTVSYQCTVAEKCNHRIFLRLIDHHQLQCQIKSCKCKQPYSIKNLRSAESVLPCGLLSFVLSGIPSLLFTCDILYYVV